MRSYFVISYKIYIATKRCSTALAALVFNMPSSQMNAAINNKLPNVKQMNSNKNFARIRAPVYLKYTNVLQSFSADELKANGKCSLR